MKLDRIVNIVFYKYLENGKEQTKACIFYRGGKASIVSYEDGIEACVAIVKEKNITSEDVFEEMINKELIHVVSGEEFVTNFNKYVSHDTLDYDIVNEKVAEKANKISATDTPIVIDQVTTNGEELAKDGGSLEEEEFDKDTKFEKDEDSLEDEDSYYNNFDYISEGFAPVDYALHNTNDDTIEQPVIFADEKDEQPGFFRRAINKIKQSKLASRITAVAVTLAVGLGMYSCANRKTAYGGMYNSNITNAKLLDDLDMDDILEFTTKASAKAAKKAETDITTDVADNGYYDGYTYEQLLEVTTNEAQKQAMQNVHDTLEKFNGKFADAYVEEGRDIRAALSFDEVVALQQAYNDYSKEEIKAIFNGVEIDFKGLSNAFKDANLQLMGAHVIETRENPVDMSLLINSEEGKAYYQRFHEMFLDAKEAQGEDKLAKVKKFYDAVRAEFPITEEVRTEGIAHSDSRNSLRSEQLSVIPMISAAEMLFQNLSIDYTLSDTQIDYLNDIGLCNMADEKFRKIETISLYCDNEDIVNPTYLQYRDAIVNKLISENHYVIDDKHRDLSQLDAFQDAVNWHFEMDEAGYFTGSIYYTTDTYTVTKSWTEKHTTYHEEETRVSKPIPASEKEKIDKRIEAENKVARRKGLEEAKKNQRKMQKEEDRKAKELEKEVKKDAKDLQDKIDAANDQIKKNHDDDPSNDKPVNEDDLGHGVDFDDEHSDSKGNLNDSVENITTDPTGDQTGKELPDPNETGKKFDAEYGESSDSEPEYTEPASEEPSHSEPEYTEPASEEPSDSEPEYTEPASEEPSDSEPEYTEPVTEEPVDSEPEYTEPVVYTEPVEDETGGYFEEPVDSEPEYTETAYEEIVSEYVDALASEEEVEEEAYEYTK